MTRDQIITQLFTGKNFNQCIEKMEPDHLRDDLKMEVALIVCEWPDEKVIKLHQDKAIEFYVVRVILNLIQSSTSPFARKYRALTLPIESIAKITADQYKEDEDRRGKEYTAADLKFLADHELRLNRIDDCDFQERLSREQAEDRALAAVEELYWYDREIVKLYKEYGNYRAIEKETRIPYSSTFKTAKKAFKELKQKALCSTGI